MFKRHEYCATKPPPSTSGRHGVTAVHRNKANARTVLLVVVCFVFGMGVGAIWLHRVNTTREAADAGMPGTPDGLSASTKAVLSRLDGPAQVRYYSLLDAGDDSLKSFAVRVNELLSKFERASDGRLTVERVETWSETNTKNASADGVIPFNLDRGAPSYHGLSLSYKARKETIARISPEWEPSLEYDVARAIERLAKPQPFSRPPVEAAQAAAAEEAIKQAFPDLSKVSLQEGKRILQEAALQEVKSALVEMERELGQIRQQILKAESANAAADRQTAVDQLQAAQIKHTEKLSAIARNSEAQIEALSRLKGQ